MIEWEPNKNDANLNIPVDGQVASICWNEQTKLLTMSLAYSAVYGMGERYNGLNQNDRIVKIDGGRKVLVIKGDLKVIAPRRSFSRIQGSLSVHCLVAH